MAGKVEYYDFIAKILDNDLYRLRLERFSVLFFFIVSGAIITSQH